MRRNLRATVVLVLLTGLGAGVVMASVAAVRRADQGWGALQAHNPDGDAAVAILSEDGQFPILSETALAAEADIVRGFPGVVHVTRSAAPIFMASAHGREPSAVVGLLELDPPRPGTNDQPIVVAGRLADPSAADEAVLDEEEAAKLGVGVGDEVELTPNRLDQFKDLEQSTSTPADGPPSTVRIVGVIRGPIDVLGPRAEASTYTEDGQIRLTGAWWDQVDHDVASYGLGMGIDLADGAAGREQLAEQMQEAFGDAAVVAPGLEFDIGIQPEVRDAIGNRLTAEGRAQAAFAAVAAIVALAIVGQALVRQLRAEAVDQVTLQGLGVQRGELLVAGLLRSAVLAVGGAGAAVVVALVASAWLPRGVGARVVTELRGIHADAVVLVGGATITLLVVLALAALASLWAPVPLTRTVIRPSWADRAVGFGLPVTAVLGLRTAFDRSSASRAGRAAVLAAALAVATVVAAAGLRGSYDAFVTDPDEVGQVWDASAGNFVSPEGVQEGVRALSGIDGVAALARGELNATVDVEGQTVTAMAYQAAVGKLRPLVYEGRAPTGAHEVMLGRLLAESLGVEVGDEVDIQFAVEDTPLPPFDVVGIGVAGSALADAAPGTSVLVDGDVIQQIDDFETAQVLLVRFDDDADPAQVLRAIRAEYPDSTLPSPILPRAVQTIGSLSSLPVVLAALVALLATGVVVNALLGSVRMGRHRIGVLKSLGCTRAQVAGVVGWQATGWAAGAVLIGVPLGMLLSSVGWRAIQRSLGMEAPIVVPWLILVLAAAVVLVGLNVIALVPSRRAARVPAAEALRAE